MLSTRAFVNGISNIKKFSKMHNFKPVTHVIFDMDGVILDTEKLYKISLQTVIGKYGKDYPPDVRLAVLGTKAQDTARICVEHLNLPVSPDQFAVEAKLEQSKLMGDATLMPGAERLIKHLSWHKIPIAIATSSGADNFRIKTAKHPDLFAHFHHIVKGSSDPEVKNGKPAPDIFLIAARRFKNPPKPEECLVFEDSPNGVKAAKRAGMQVVMVPEDYIPKEYRTEATIIVDSLLDFKPELFGLPPFSDDIKN